MENTTNTIHTQVYGELNIIESEFWGKGDNGEKITTIINVVNKRNNLYQVDLYVDDVLVISGTTLDDVGNELDSLGIQRI